MRNYYTNATPLASVPILPVKIMIASTQAQIEIPNTTKIIIAQRISSVENADVIIILDDGRINAIGNHESLLKDNDIYREIYTSQTKGASLQ